MTKANTDRALVLAAEYRRLVADGRYPEADQARKTIDDLVGRFNAAGRLVLPAAVRDAMGK